MYKKTALSEQFYQVRGNSSLRPLTHALTSQLPANTPVISAATLKEQFETLNTQLRTARDAMNTKPDAAKRCHLENLIRQVGHLRAIIEQTDQMQFERVLVAVCESHLPKDWFLQFVAEARELWRDQGNGWLNLSDYQKRRNRRRFIKRRYWNNKP